MCNPGAACRFCTDYEFLNDCPTVRRALPIAADGPEAESETSALKSAAGQSSYKRGHWSHRQAEPGVKLCCICRLRPAVTGSYCRQCDRIKHAAYRARNRDRINARQREAYARRKSPESPSKP